MISRRLIHRVIPRKAHKAIRMVIQMGIPKVILKDIRKDIRKGTSRVISRLGLKVMGMVTHRRIPRERILTVPSPIMEIREAIRISRPGMSVPTTSSLVMSVSLIIHPWIPIPISRQGDLVNRSPARDGRKLRGS